VSGVRVVADEENNALLIYATGKEFAKIEAALKRLDVVATQVIIEASILEVRLTDELRYGLEWTFKNSVGDDYSGFGQLITTGRDVAAIVPGFSYTVTNGVGDISAVLNALAEKSLINVISTPSVMVLDNHTASIHVGDQVPVETSTTVTDGGNQIQSIDFRDTGVKLSVTPSVNAGGMVVMDISQSVTDVGEIDLATGQRSFLERNIESRVAVRTDESVVLGGLIRENASTGKSGVPWLVDIPVVGNLFGSTDNSDRRTELLVIITPRVLFNEADLREVSREMRERMRHFDLIDVTKSSQLRDVDMHKDGEAHDGF
jgi:general secretion pathway protein D